MHLFDPQRPKLGSGRPELIDCHTAVPSFDTTPIDSNTILLEVMLRPNQDRGFVWYSYQTKVSELSRVMAEYISDPEGTLVKYFNWDPAKVVTKRPQTPKTAPTIKTRPRTQTTPVDRSVIESINIDELD